MKRHVQHVSRAIGAGLLASSCAAPAVRTPSQPPAALEEIYVLRSIREPHAPVADFCSSARTGFDPFPADAERAFSFWSVTSERQNGRVVEPRDARAASLRGCFGPTAEPARQKFYAEIELASIAFRGEGECGAIRVDFPEAHLFPVHCWLVLKGLPAGYVGGLLTTNTLASRATYGGETDPPGYTQASIATIRLWRSR